MTLYCRSRTSAYGKISEVDSFLRRPTSSSVEIQEVHPEVSLALWAGQPMPHHKESAEGRAERVALIDRRWPEQRDALWSTNRGVPGLLNANCLAINVNASRGRFTQYDLPGDLIIDGVIGYRISAGLRVRRVHPLGLLGSNSVQRAFAYRLGHTSKQCPSGRPSGGVGGA